MPSVRESEFIPYPLYDTTFTLHRVSPLYTGHDSSLDNASLIKHARRFRDILAGETLRGVRVSLGSQYDAVAHAGSLHTVEWQILPEEDLWGREDETMMYETKDFGRGKGILVDIKYEKIQYRAILLREEGVHNEKDGFERFPLLLTRMPSALRDTFTAFLATTFDARLSPIHIPSSALTAALEKYVFDCGIGDNGEALSPHESYRNAEKILRDVQIRLQFTFPQSGSGIPPLNMDFTVSQEDLQEFIQYRETETSGSHFMSTMAKYVEKELAMDVNHKGCVISRIACGSFVLGAEGRVKMNAPSAFDEEGVQRRATWEFINGLVALVKGGNT